jgi:hypothetical protein
MKTYGGVEVKLYTFLISAIDGDEWLALRSDRFTPGERTVVIAEIGWVKEMVWTGWQTGPDGD